MRILVLLLALMLPSVGYSQLKADIPNERSIGWIKIQTVVTDSVVWVTTEVDSLNLGDESCQHDWVCSDEWRAGGMSGCLVNHNGWHCDWDDQMRNRICKKCLRKETQREQWYEHELEFPESEYEKLEDRLNKNNEDALPVTIEQADITGATGIYHFKSIEADTIIADGSIFDPMWTTKVPAIDFNGDIPDSLWWCIRVPNMPNLEKIYQMFKKRYNREQAKAIFDNLKLHDNDWMGPAIIIETKEPTDE